MSKQLTAEIIEELQKKQGAAAFLVQADFRKLYEDPIEGEIVYLTNAGQDLIWKDINEDPQLYTGAGELLDISFIEDSTELQSYNIEVSFSGVRLEDLVRALELKYYNNFVKIYLAHLDDQYQVIEDPFIVFAGRMDQIRLNIGPEFGTIVVSVTSRLSDWEVPRGGRYTHSYQQTYYDSLDVGFEYLPLIADIPIRWGNKRLEATVLNRAGHRGNN